MTLTLSPSLLGGTVAAPVSKSAAHRLLISAALADRPTVIDCDGSNADIDATVGCLRALGAKIEHGDGQITVCPIPKGNPICGSILDCGESGSTERFLLPVALALGASATLIGRGRLPSRPLSPLYELLCEHGAKMSENGRLPLFAGGRIEPGYYRIDGGVSSQFISGLLFALPLLEKPSVIEVTGRLESAHYIEMTLAAQRIFGIDIRREGNRFLIPGDARYTSPEHCTVEGDWSSAAFLLAAGAVGGAPVCCTGLSPDSLQGDRAVFEILAAFGADCSSEGGCFTVAPNRPLRAIRVDGRNIPDLIPILSVVAAFAEGDTVFDNIARLRIKESDRVRTTCEMLAAFGVSTESDENSLTVHGGLTPTRSPRITQSYNDHRIAMSTAVLASAAVGDTVLHSAEAVAKSYPRFFDDYASLGGKAIPSTEN